MISPKSTRSNRARYRRFLELRVVVLRQIREESCAQLAGACLAERLNTSVFYEGPFTGHVICLPRLHASFAMCPARAATPVSTRAFGSFLLLTQSKKFWSLSSPLLGR